MKGYLLKEERRDPNRQLYAGFLVGIYFYPEDGGKMLLQNVSRFSADYTALYPTI